MNSTICSRLRLLVIITLIVGVVLAGLITNPVSAAPANPDSITLYSVKVFQNIFEDDDMLFVATYEVEYIYAGNVTTEPDEPASETFLLALYDTNGTSLLFSRELNYYQYNIHSLYLDADTAESLTWESEYRVRVMGLPIYFAPEEDETMDTMILSSSAHWISGTMSASRALLKSHCLNLAETLEEVWETTLLISTSEGYVLNSLGRIVFLDAIPNLDDILPDLFQIAISDLSGDDTPYDGTYEAETKIETMLGPQITAAFTGVGNIFHISGTTVAFMWIAFIALTIASIVFLSTGNTTVSLILCVPILILGAYLGAIPLALLFVLGTLIVIYLGYHIWLRGQ